MRIKYTENELKDIKLSRSGLNYYDLPPLKKCNCGGQPYIDVSMALIQCDSCGLCFEYRYNRGVIPYYTWESNQKEKSKGAH